MQQIAPSEYRRMLARELEALGLIPVPFTATTAVGSPNLTNATNIQALEVGMVVSGPGIPPGSTIWAINLTLNTVYITNNATANGNNVPLQAVITGNVQVHLIAAPPTPGPEPTPASFTEANFDGYAPILLSNMTQPWTDGEGNAESDTPRLAWILTTTPVVGNNIFGYWVDYVVGSPSAIVRLWEAFPQPIPMSVAGNAVVIVVPFETPGLGKVEIVV